MSGKRESPILNGKLLSDLDLNGHKLLGLNIPENSGGSSVDVVAPSPDGDGKAADAKAVYEALEVKQSKLSQEQMGAVDSGITAEKVEKLNGIEAGAQKNPDLSEYAKKSDIPAAPDLSEYAKTAEVLPRYPFVNGNIVDGVLTVQPYAVTRMQADGDFTIQVGGDSSTARDCCFMLMVGGVAPTITWPADFHPRTDAETDFACVAGVRNVYWITEYAQGEFAVAGWQETEGGSGE